MPEKINGDTYEATEEFFDFEYVSLPKDFVKAFKNVFEYISDNRDDLEEIMDINEVNLNVDDYEISLPDFEKLFKGVNKFKSAEDEEFTGIDESSETIQIDSAAIPSGASYTSENGSEFV